MDGWLRVTFCFCEYELMGSFAFRYVSFHVCVAGLKHTYHVQVSDYRKFRSNTHAVMSLTLQNEY